MDISSANQLVSLFATIAQYVCTTNSGRLRGRLSMYLLRNFGIFIYMPFDSFPSVVNFLIFHTFLPNSFW
jgi:hypothetical protein